MTSLLINYDENKPRYVIAWILLMITNINSISSILLLLLIRYMNKIGALKMNCYIKIVVVMTLSQFALDLSWYGLIFELNSTEQQFYRFFCGTFGVSSALWSFYIIVMVWLTSLTTGSGSRKKASTNEILNYMYVSNFIISLSVGIPMAFVKHELAWKIYGKL